MKMTLKFLSEKELLTPPHLQGDFALFNESKKWNEWEKEEEKRLLSGGRDGGKLFTKSHSYGNWHFCVASNFWSYPWEYECEYFLSPFIFKTFLSHSEGANFRRNVWPVGSLKKPFVFVWVYAVAKRRCLQRREANLSRLWVSVFGTTGALNSLSLLYALDKRERKFCPSSSENARIVWRDSLASLRQGV